MRSAGGSASYGIPWAAAIGVLAASTALHRNHLDG